MAGCSSLAVAQADSPGSRHGSELIVTFDWRQAPFPNPESAISRVRSGDELALGMLGRPINARHLVPLRILPSFLAELPSNDPRVRLHQAVVLTYADTSAAAAAEFVLRGAREVAAVERTQGLRFHVTPSDPLFTNSFTGVDHQKYQWAAHQLKLASAWNFQLGYGYVGVLDNGVQTNGLSNQGLHEDLQSAFRSQFSYNFGYANNGVYNDPPHNPRHGGGTNTAGNLDEEPYNLMQGTSIAIPSIAGHGTHVAGIIAGTANSVGVAGGCQHCSLALGRVSAWFAPTQQLYPDSGHSNSGVTWMTNLGVQVINISFGAVSSQFGCTSSPLACSSLDAAAAHDVAVVAAVGNDRNGAPGMAAAGVDFPASYVGVIAVAGTQYSTSGPTFWDGTGSFGSNRSTRTDIAAPASDVISSVYEGTNWSPSTCGDDLPSGYFAKYGICSGTSMAAPHVSAILQLYRSTKPTAAVSDARAALTSSAIACSGSLGANCGAGVPDAEKVVREALGNSLAINRLTPLFSFYSSDRDNHFYTVAPQMATAAILGTLLPVSFTGSQYSYSSIGPLTPGYSAFPGVPLSGCGFSPPCDPRYPRAMASVFTGYRNPHPGGPELVPLYRLSWACPSSSDPNCTNNQHVSHVYSTNVPGEGWLSVGYKVDGIEGYVFPKTMNQPAGTVKLCRKYYELNDDYILFPGAGAGGTDCSVATDQYTPGSNYTQSFSDDWIGWVYTARAPQPVLDMRKIGAIAVLLED